MSAPNTGCCVRSDFVPGASGERPLVPSSVRKGASANCQEIATVSNGGAQVAANQGRKRRWMSPVLPLGPSVVVLSR